MNQTNKLMAGVTAAMIVSSPGPSMSAGAPDRTGNEWQLAQAPAPAVGDAEDAVELLLHQTSKENAKTLDELLPDLPGISRDAAKQAIDTLMAKEEIQRIGAGTTGDPYRYWSKPGYRP
jgi:hypothetical protein